MSNYLTYYNGANVFWVQLIQTAVPDGTTSVTYDAMIYNFNTNQWDLACEVSTSRLPDTSGGWTVHESDMQQAEDRLLGARSSRERCLYANREDASGVWPVKLWRSATAARSPWLRPSDLSSGAASSPDRRTSRRDSSP